MDRGKTKHGMVLKKRNTANQRQKGQMRGQKSVYVHEKETRRREGMRQQAKVHRPGGRLVPPRKRRETADLALCKKKNWNTEGEISGLRPGTAVTVFALISYARLPRAFPSHISTTPQGHFWGYVGTCCTRVFLGYILGFVFFSIL